MPKRLRQALLWAVVYVLVVSSAIGLAYLCGALIRLGWHPLVIVIVGPLALLGPAFLIVKFMNATIFKD